MPVIKIDDSVEVLTDPERDLNIEKQAMNMAQSQAAQNEQWQFLQLNPGFFSTDHATNDIQNAFYDSILTRMKAAGCYNTEPFRR